MKRVSAPISSPPKRIGTLIIEPKAKRRIDASCASLAAALRYQSSSMAGWNAASPVVSAHTLSPSARACGVQRVGRRIASASSSSCARMMRTTSPSSRASKKPKSPRAGRHAASVCSSVSR